MTYRVRVVTEAVITVEADSEAEAIGAASVEVAGAIFSGTDAEVATTKEAQVLVADYTATNAFLMGR